MINSSATRTTVSGGVIGSSSTSNPTVTFTESGLPGGANRSGNGSVGLHLVVEFLAGDMPALDNVISLAPYLKAGDNVDIYDYSSTNPIDPTLVGQDAVKLRAAVPSGVAISVDTGLIPNVQAMASAHPTDVNGGLGDTYEPYGATAPGTYAFSAALQNFSEVNQIAHNAGYTSVAYPTGHPLLHEQSYGWNYGQIAQKTDLVWIETQEYAFAGATTPSVWSTAMATLASQFASTGEPLSHLAVQIDLGSNATGNDPQGWGVTPPTCISEIRTALTYGINDIYLWTARGAEVLLAQLLQNLTQEIPQRSQTGSSGGSSVAMNWSVTLNGVVHTSNTSTISFSEPNGTYSYSVLSPIPGQNGSRYVATPSSGTVTVNGANASVGVSYTRQFPLHVSVSPSGTGSATPSNGWHAAGSSVTLVATPASGYSFAKWAGSGRGSYSGTNDPAVVTMQGAINETAKFTTQPASPATIFFNETGLPPNTPWTVGVNGEEVTTSNASIPFEVSPGTYAYSVPNLLPATSPGVQFVPTPANGTLGVGNTSVGVAVAFATEFTVNVSVTPSGAGSAHPSSGWHSAGSVVDLSAKAANGFLFSQWVGSGTGSYSGTNLSAAVTVDAPLGEVAEFVSTRGQSNLSLQVTGLPAGFSWTAFVGGTSRTTNQSSLTIPINSSTVSYSVESPINGTPGIRFVAQPDSGTVNVTGPTAQVTVVYAEEALVTARTVGSGTVVVTPSNDGWYVLGSQVTLVATATNGSVFAGWSGNGTGSSAGSANPLVLGVGGPIVEVAYFVSAPAPTPSGPGGLGSGLFSALLVSILVLTAVIGTALAMNAGVRWVSRRRRR